MGNIKKNIFLVNDRKNQYRYELDGLRALAILAAIINHLNKAFLPSGFLEVDIFFVISGYVITSSSASKQYSNFKKLLENTVLRNKVHDLYQSFWIIQNQIF